MFCTVLPVDHSFSLWHGYIKVRNREFAIRLGSKQSGTFEFSCDRSLQVLLRGHEAILRQRWEQTHQIAGFLVELKAIITRILRADSNNTHLHPHEFYTRLIDEINTAGMEKLAYADESLHNFKFTITDDCGRSHVLTVRIRCDYPFSPPVTACPGSLPVQPQLIWDSQKGSLVDIIKQYEDIIREHLDLFRILDDFDKNTTVLEPQNPTYAETSRRIVISDGKSFVSMLISIDPKQPYGICQCRFLGADRTVVRFRNLLNKNLHIWNWKQLPRFNLEKILELGNNSFPRLSEDGKFGEGLNMECGICYSYRTEDKNPSNLSLHKLSVIPEIEIPSLVCLNTHCGRLFHHRCLADWLQSLPDTRTSFNTLFGHCPYCQHSITVDNNNLS